MLSDNLPYAQKAKLKLLTNEIAGQRLTPVEVAHAINEFLETTKWTQLKLATEMGYDAKIICGYMTLLKLPEDIQKLVHEGELLFWTAVEIQRADEKARAEFFEKLRAGQRVTKTEVRDIKVENRWAVLYEGKDKAKAAEVVRGVDPRRRIKVLVMNG